MITREWFAQTERDRLCPSDLALDQLLTGELGKGTPRAQAHLAHIQACQVCTDRLSRMEAVGVQLLAEYPKLEGIPVVEVGRSGSGARAGIGWAVAVTMTLAAMVIVVGTLTSRSGLRAKGATVTLGVFVRRGDGRVEALRPEDLTYPGDAVRFKVSSRASGYLGVVSIDGAGAVNGYVPLRGRLAPIAAGEAQLVEGSIVLDGRLGSERVIAFVCDEPLEIDHLTTAVRGFLEHSSGGRGAVDLSFSCAQSSFWFVKVARP